MRFSTSVAVSLMTYRAKGSDSHSCISDRYLAWLENFLGLSISTAHLIHESSSGPVDDSRQSRLTIPPTATVNANATTPQTSAEA